MNGIAMVTPSVKVLWLNPLQYQQGWEESQGKTEMGRAEMDSPEDDGCTGLIGLIAADYQSSI